MGGYGYSVSQDDLVRCMVSDCMWYRCLKKDIFDGMIHFHDPEREVREVEIGVREIRARKIRVVAETRGGS